MSEKNKPLVVGITGGMGSGKSTVARIFSERYGIPVYEADAEAKKVMHRPDVRRKIQDAFGAETYVDGKLDTGYLAGLVFGNEKRLKKLESIVHPEVRKDFAGWLQRQKDVPYVILENAILFKSGMDKLCDFVVYVRADKEHRIRRVKQRDGISEAAIEKRLKHQSADNFFIKKSHFVLNNNDSIVQLSKKIKNLHEKFINAKNI